MRHRLWWLKAERGVAMVTVLLVGAALTVVSSTAAFVTIQDLRAGGDDRRAALAHGFAEAGIDRMLLAIRQGNLHWGQIREAACAVKPIVLTGPIGNGTYRSVLTVFDPSQPPATRLPAVPNPVPDPWPTTNDSLAPCTTVTQAKRPTRPATHQFAITSTGTSPTATRVLRQVVEIGSLGLPIGVYAERIFANGTPQFKNVSMITPGDVEGREKMRFSGTDPNYTVGSFWPGATTTDPAAQVPAAIHSTGTIFLKKDVGGGKTSPDQEHPPARNCTANPDTTAPAQSQWDQSGEKRGGPLNAACPLWTGPPTGYPPTSLFTTDDLARVAPTPELSEQDYQILADSAKRTGLYCFFATNGTDTCTKAGQPWTFNRTGTVSQTDVDITPGGITERNFVAYFDFQDATKALVGNLVKWKAAVRAAATTICSEDPNLNRTVTLVVRRGSLSLEGGTIINGAVLVPEGRVNQEGDSIIHGTVIAHEFNVTGNGTFSIDDCWVNNQPGPFLDVATRKWSEIDR